MAVSPVSVGAFQSISSVPPPGVTVWICGAPGNEAMTVKGETPRFEGPAISVLSVLDLKSPLAGRVLAQVPGRTKAELGGQHPFYRGGSGQR